MFETIKERLRVRRELLRECSDSDGVADVFSDIPYGRLAVRMTQGDDNNGKRQQP